MRGGCSRLGIHNVSCLFAYTCTHVYISIVIISTHSNSWQHFEPKFAELYAAELYSAENWQGVVAVEKWQGESPNGAGLIYPLLGNTYVLLEQYSKEIAG